MATVLIVSILAILTAACGSDGDAAPDPAESPGNEAVTASSQPSSTQSTTAPSTTSTAPAIEPDNLALPTTAAELASELDLAEAAVRDPELSDQMAMAWGRRQQSLYRTLARNDGWAAEVLAGVSEPYRFAVTKNWEARQELSSLVTSASLSTVLPAWRIREPLPAAELRTYYDEAESATGIGWEYLAAINLIETRMGRIEGLSTAGATGPMQFLPSTWAECCEGDPTVDRDAINGAAVYLRDRGGPADMAKALFGYNRSDYYVAAVSAYADVLRDDPAALRGYHAWQVYFRAEPGLVVIPVGYEEPEPIDAAKWIAANPGQLVE